jgi:GlcNAc-P-P-Und epimerase
LPKRILITGGSGFIGTNIVEHYSSIGDEVVNIDIQRPRNVDHLDLWQNLDILDHQKLSSFIQKFAPDVVFHMAARTDLGGSNLSEYSANTVGVTNLIAALNNVDKVAMVVFASSMLVCKLGFLPQKEDDYCPGTVYGRSKVLGEEIIRNSVTKFQWLIVRPTSIWGPWFGSPYRDFFSAIKSNFYVHPKGLRVRRSYGFVYNTVYQLDCLGRALDTELIGKTFYLADYQAIELKAWADKIQESLKVRPIKEVPFLLIRIAAKLGDMLKIIGLKNPPMTSFRLNNMRTEMVHDTLELEAYCGETPFSTSDGVEITCAWMTKNNKPG